MPSYVIDEKGSLKPKTESFSEETLLILRRVYRLNKILSDFTKLKILYLLRSNEASVTHIKNDVRASQSLISHSLATLRKEGLVLGRRQKKMVHYSLTPLGKLIINQNLLLNNKITIK